MDALSLSSILVSTITALGVLIHQIHLKNCSCFCINSDCSKTPPASPTEEEEEEEKKVEPKPHEHKRTTSV